MVAKEKEQTETLKRLNSINFLSTLWQVDIKVYSSKNNQLYSKLITEFILLIFLHCFLLTITHGSLQMSLTMTKLDMQNAFFLAGIMRMAIIYRKVHT